MEFQVKLIVQGFQRCNSDYFLPLFQNNVFTYYSKISSTYPLYCDYAHPYSPSNSTPKPLFLNMPPSHPTTQFHALFTLLILKIQSPISTDRICKGNLLVTTLLSSHQLPGPFRLARNVASGAPPYIVRIVNGLILGKQPPLP